MQAEAVERTDTKMDRYYSLQNSARGVNPDYLPSERHNDLRKVLIWLFKLDPNLATRDTVTQMLNLGIRSPHFDTQVQNMPAGWELRYTLESGFDHTLTLRLRHPDPDHDPAVYIDMTVRYDDMHRFLRDANLIQWLPSPKAAGIIYGCV